MTNEIETVKLNKNYDTAIVIDEVDDSDKVAIFWIEDSGSFPLIFNREDAENVIIPAIREGKTIKHNTKTDNLYIYDSSKKVAVVEQYEDGYYTINTIRLAHRQHHVI